MATDNESVVQGAGDKYRSFLHEDANKVEWRHGGPPIYDSINKIFEEGRTKVLIKLPLFFSTLLSIRLCMSEFNTMNSIRF